MGRELWFQNDQLRSCNLKKEKNFKPHYHWKLKVIKHSPGLGSKQIKLIAWNKQKRVTEEWTMWVNVIFFFPNPHCDSGLVLSGTSLSVLLIVYQEAFVSVLRLSKLHSNGGGGGEEMVCFEGTVQQTQSKRETKLSDSSIPNTHAHTHPWSSMARLFALNLSISK